MLPSAPPPQQPTSFLIRVTFFLTVHCTFFCPICSKGPFLNERCNCGTASPRCQRFWPFSFFRRGIRVGCGAISSFSRILPLITSLVSDAFCPAIASLGYADPLPSFIFRAFLLFFFLASRPRRHLPAPISVQAIRFSFAPYTQRMSLVSVAAQNHGLRFSMHGTSFFRQTSNTVSSNGYLFPLSGLPDWPFLWPHVRFVRYALFLSSTRPPKKVAPLPALPFNAIQSRHPICDLCPGFFWAPFVNLLRHFELFRFPFFFLRQSNSFFFARQFLPSFAFLFLS